MKKYLLLVLVLISPLAFAAAVVSIHGQFYRFDANYYYFKATDKTEYRVDRSALLKKMKPTLNKVVTLTLPEKDVRTYKLPRRNKASLPGRR